MQQHPSTVCRRLQQQPNASPRQQLFPDHRTTKEGGSWPDCPALYCAALTVLYCTVPHCTVLMALLCAVLQVSQDVRSAQHPLAHCCCLHVAESAFRPPLPSTSSCLCCHCCAHGVDLDTRLPPVNSRLDQLQLAPAGQAGAREGGGDSSVGKQHNTSTTQGSAGRHCTVVLLSTTPAGQGPQACQQGHGQAVVGIGPVQKGKQFFYSPYSSCFDAFSHHTLNHPPHTPLSLLAPPTPQHAHPFLPHTAPPKPTCPCTARQSPAVSRSCCPAAGVV